MLYQILFVLLLLGGYFSFSQMSPNEEYARRRYLIFVCVLLIIQSGLRNLAVGADTYQYYRVFHRVEKWPWAKIWQNFYTVYVLGEDKDAGYPLLEKLFSTFITSNFQVFLVAVALFFFHAWGKFVYRYVGTTTGILVASSTYMLLFYNFFSITGIRQTIAIACGIHCFLALQDKRYMKYVLFFIPAFFIHKSAAILLIYPILLHVNNFRRITLTAIIGFILAIPNRSFLVTYFQDLAEYKDYHSRLPYALMLLFFVVCIFVWYIVRRTEEDHQMRKLYNIFCPTFVCIPLLGWDSLFMREVLYFSVFSTILIPFAFHELKDKILTLEFAIFSLAYFLVQNPEYRFFWEYMKLGSNYQ